METLPEPEAVGRHRPVSKAARRCLSLAKGEQRFVFWYHQGREAELMAALLQMADNDETEFDWFDAAVLSFRMGRQTEAKAR